MPQTIYILYYNIISIMAAFTYLALQDDTPLELDMNKNMKVVSQMKQRETSMKTKREIAEVAQAYSLK